MPTVKVNSQVNLSVEEILNGISQLGNKELELFLNQVGNLLARRKAPNFSKREAELLIEINQGIAQKTLDRYKMLSDKMAAETLTEQEHQELLAISNQLEEQDAKRLELLIELARLRSVSLDTLMEDLGLTVSEDV